MGGGEWACRTACGGGRAGAMQGRGGAEAVACMYARCGARSLGQALHGVGAHGAVVAAGGHDNLGLQHCSEGTASMRG